MLVTSVFHEKIGARHMVGMAGRIVMMVVMKFTAPRDGKTRSCRAKHPQVSTRTGRRRAPASG